VITPSAVRRPSCSACLRARSACICHWITPLVHGTEVLILQHPLEQSQAKGSARLLHLSLPGSRLVVGESFDPGELQALMYGPLGGLLAGAPADTSPDEPAREPVLLYPEAQASPPGTAAVLSPAAGPVWDDPGRLRLVVLDGTWRKSRKMLHLNPGLQALPRLALRDPPPSHYLIRKAHRPDQLSTLEATCLALAQLAGGPTICQALLSAFDGFVAEQQARASVTRHP
jgi:DTW domain-containing protein